MIRTIFVPTSGTATDDGVFATALAIAQPLGAHLDFFHLRISPVEAMLRAPHADFVAGPAINDALNHLREQEETLAGRAVRSVEAFCATHGIEQRAVPGVAKEVTASWLEETDEASRRMMLHARHSDLVVLGRPQNTDFLPRPLIEDLLLGCGRPIVLAPSAPPKSVTGTIMVGWKEKPEAARALASALPLLERARRVVLVTVPEAGAAPTEALDDLVRQLAWHGIAAETRLGGDGFRPATMQLLQTAAELEADMLVVGGFGHGPLRELVFGGVTQTLIGHADLPVFIQH